MKSNNIYSIFRNIENTMKRNVRKEHPFHRLLLGKIFDNERLGIKQQCISITRHINSNLFSLNDFKCYMLYKHFFLEKVTWKDVDIKEIPLVAKLFAPKTLKKETQLIKDICERANISDMDSLYKINSNGNNILLDLIHKNYISPVFYFIFYQSDVSKTNFERSKEIEIIERTIKKIKKNKGESSWLIKRIKKEK